MTMQVGMVGSDGIVLASDMAWNQRAGNREVRHGHVANKIRLDEKRGIAISCAGDMLAANKLADRILFGLRDDNLLAREHAILDLGNKVLAKEADRDVQCLMVFRDPVPTLYFFQRGTNSSGHRESRCEIRLDKAYAGDTSNPALYWAERFYAQLPVDQLMPLAAQVILSAGKLNPAIMGGLEVVVLDSSGFQRLSEDANRDLQAKIAQRIEKVREMVLSPVPVRTKHEQDPLGALVAN
jgi:hypothetical protein